MYALLLVTTFAVTAGPPRGHLGGQSGGGRGHRDLRSGRLLRLVRLLPVPWRLDGRVRAGKDEGLVTGVEPAHDIGRGAVLAADLEDLAVPFVVGDMGAAHVEPVTD